MSEQNGKSQARLAAELVVGQFWLRQVDRIARDQLEREDKNRKPIGIYPPRETDFADAAVVLEALIAPLTTEIALAVPATKARKQSKRS